MPMNYENNSYVHGNFMPRQANLRRQGSLRKPNFLIAEMQAVCQYAFSNIMGI